VVSFRNPADTPAMPGMLRKSTASVPRYQKFESTSLQRRVICEPGPERPAALVHDRTSDLVIIAWRRPSPVRLSLPPAAAISICISARILRSGIRATPTGDVHIPPAGTDGPRRTRRREGTRRTLGTGQMGAGRVAGGFPLQRRAALRPLGGKHPRRQAGEPELRGGGNAPPPVGRDHASLGNRAEAGALTSSQNAAMAGDDHQLVPGVIVPPPPRPLPVSD
jgi:hypothetical protein